jgi:hypothetical protein
VRAALRSFALADAAGWPGLPAGLALEDLEAVLPLAEDVRGEGVLGEERRAASWVGAESSVYEGGVRVWHEGRRVLVLEGRDPVGADGEPLAAPDLGEPDALFDTVLGRLVLPGGERLYAARGLALRVNPENGLLLGVLAFAPTTAEDYRARLRPELRPRRLLAGLALTGGRR